MTVLPSRLVDYYVKHPVDGAGWLLDGEPLDAGSAMILASNLAHLIYEGPRHLVHSLGPGTVHKFASESAMFAGFENGDPLDQSAAPAAVVTLPWDRRCAQRFGPFFAIFDREDANGLRRSRGVHMEVRLEVEASATVHDVIFAMTDSPNPPSGGMIRGGIRGQSSPIRCLDWEDHLSIGTGERVVTTTTPLDFSPAEGIATPVACRADGSNATSVIRVTMFWLWFGWRIVTGGAGNSYVTAFSAYETEP